jgi:predicted nucleic acid-binding protein
MLFIDSNIWCYYFDQRLSEHKKVKEIIREIIKSTEIVCNTIIVMEVSHYLVRHFDETTARKKIDFFINLQNMEIVDFNRQLMTEALECLIDHAYSYGLGGRDATIIATINLKSITKIVSHDDIFKRLASKLKFEVVDPVQMT